ncbi:MAG: hypothetical protein KC897_11320 [Candidatus Omnitrophica bacterium]|nr:hypothetical protein [Candidatus Omnitrophota bacterium]MCB9721732.1 hypothetical protein [Candidatus Omnitrophota bacterium]
MIAATLRTRLKRTAVALTALAGIPFALFISPARADNRPAVEKEIKEYRTGRRECEHRTADGHTQSRCVDLFASGKLRMLSHYRDGVLHGEKKSYYFDGQLRQDYVFAGGLPRGTYVNFYDNGQLSYRFTAPEDTIVHRAEYFYPDGGLWQSAAFVNRKPHGEVAVYDINGKIIDKLTARSNVFYDSEGRPLQGEHRLDYADGRPMLVRRFRDGRLHGDREIYLPDGNLYTLYHFENGQFQGRSFEYYLSGTLRVIKYYQNHNLIYIEEFDPDGSKIYESGNSAPRMPGPGQRRDGPAATPFRT